MSMARATPGARIARLCAWGRDRRGIAAIEFAVLLPLFIILYLGTFEVGQAIAIKLNSGLAARTVADLASQYSTPIYNADAAAILGASTKVMAPYPTAPFSVTVSGVTVDANGNATVTWSDSQNGTARAVGQPVTLPNGLNTPGAVLIWGETQYVYTPSLGYVLTGSVTLSSQIFMAPRYPPLTRINS
jgi:Flp pilus assembly protein TadG